MKNARVLHKNAIFTHLKNPVVSCFFVNLLVILLILLLSSKLPPVVPLLYGQPQGDEQLATKYFLLLPAIIASGFVLLNFSLGKLMNDAFLNKVLIALMIGATILSTITTVKIFLLVGNL